MTPSASLVLMLATVGIENPPPVSEYASRLAVLNPVEIQRNNAVPLPKGPVFRLVEEPSIGESRPGVAQTPSLPPKPMGPTPADITPTPPWRLEFLFPPGTPLPGVCPMGVLTQPQQHSVDQVLDALELIQSQKADLEKIEKSRKEVLANKLEKQSERVKKVGRD